MVDKSGKPCIAFRKKANLFLDSTKNTSEITTLKTSEKFEQETVHEKKYKRLNHISEVMLDLKYHLQSEQEQYIEVIQEKVVHLLKILDVFNMFHTKGAISKIMMGNIVRMKQNIKNIVKSIILSILSKSSNDFVKVLSEKLKTFVLNLKTQVNHRMRVNKRSVVQVKESIKQLKTIKVNKLNFKNEQNNNINQRFLSVARSKLTLHFTKNISVRRLVVMDLQSTNSVEGNRNKRATSVGSLDHLKIISNTINNIALENFLNNLFRNGKNTFINGLFKLNTILFI